MREPGRSTSRDFLTGAALGAVAGFIIKDLELTAVVSYWGPRSPFVVIGIVLGGIVWTTPLRKVFALVVAPLAVLWLTVAFTPLTHWMARGLPRQDPLREADAVFVLASALQADGELSDSSMPRLIRGLELIGEGWASRLIVSEHGAPAPRYRDAASQLMDRLGLEAEIVPVGPVRNTHDEAVAVAELCRERNFGHLLVVTSPSHTRRAAAALEAEGVEVTAVPSQQIRFDLENLHQVFDADNHTRAFGVLIHERVGLLYYRLKGWIQ